MLFPGQKLPWEMSLPPDTSGLSRSRHEVMVQMQYLRHPRPISLLFLLFSSPIFFIPLPTQALPWAELPSRRLLACVSSLNGEMGPNAIFEHSSNNTWLTTHSIDESFGDPFGDPSGVAALYCSGPFLYGHGHLGAHRHSLHVCTLVAIEGVNAKSF